jgi:hypothetical protein
VTQQTFKKTEAQQIFYCPFLKKIYQEMAQDSKILGYATARIVGHLLCFPKLRGRVTKTTSVNLNLNISAG